MNGEPTQPVAVAGGLPAALGSLAALLVGFASQLAQVSLPAFVTRVVSAYVLFAAFGVVIRYLLTDGAYRAAQTASLAGSDSGIADVRPGSTVGEILGEGE